MVWRSILTFAVVVVFAFSLEASAQMDPSVLLLNPTSPDSGNSTNSIGTRGKPRESGLDSGRYTVRPRPETPVRQDPRSPNRRPQPNDQAPVVVLPTPAPVSEPVQEPNNTQFPVVEPSRPTTEENVESDAVQPRSKMIELSVAPGYLYNSSDSPYVFRSYNSNAPTASIDARIWLTTGFGLQATYLSTLSGSVSDSSNGTKSVSANQQWFTVGVRSRRLFGNARGTPSLTLGIDYFEYQFRVPTDAVMRGKLSNTGVQLSVESEIPTDMHRVWTFGFTFAPKQNHRESATAVDFTSGGTADSNSVGIAIGNKIYFDESSAVYWKLSHTVEKNLFSGEASLIDPLTGFKPEGVSVTNSFTIFQVGYSWSD